MTIDERLDRLTDGLERLKERDEALAQTMEHLSRENDRMAARMNQIMDSIASLVHVAQIHEHRISGLEGGRI